MFLASAKKKMAKKMKNKKSIFEEVAIDWD
jgi:hypothetical protein